MRSKLMIVLVIASTLAMAQKTEGWEVVFQDDFSTMDGGWFITQETKNHSKISLEKSRIVVELFDHGSKRTTNYTKIDFNKDFILMAEIGASGSAKLNKKERSDFGLQFGYSAQRYKDRQGHYSYFLNFYKKGVNIYSQRKDGSKSFQNILKTVQYNPMEYNELGIEKAGDVLSYFLNGKEILTEKSIETAGGAITFLARRKMKAFMRKITVYQKSADSDQWLSDIDGGYYDSLNAILSEVRFSGKTMELSASSENYIRKLNDYLQMIDNAHYVVESHTDDYGKSGDLKSLSQSRADLIKDMLISYGIDANKITAKGLGDFHPKTDYLVDRGRENNERIEIRIVPLPAMESGDVEEN